MTDTQFWKLIDRTIVLLRPNQLSGIPDGAVLWTINGTRVVKGRDSIDMDTRGGYLGYGLEAQG